MYLRLALNLLHFNLLLGALYALRRAPNFNEIHPRVALRRPSIPFFQLRGTKLNLVHFNLVLGALYALRRVPNFYEIPPSFGSQVHIHQKIVF